MTVSLPKPPKRNQQEASYVLAKAQSDRPKRKAPAKAAATVRACHADIAKSLLPQGTHPDHLAAASERKFPTLEDFAEASKTSVDTLKLAAGQMTRDQWVQYCHKYTDNAITKLQVSGTHLDTFYDQLREQQEGEAE